MCVATGVIVGTIDSFITPGLVQIGINPLYNTSQGDSGGGYFIDGELVAVHVTGGGSILDNGLAYLGAALLFNID